MRPLNQICMLISGGRGGNTSTSVVRALNRKELENIKYFAKKLESDRRFLFNFRGTERPTIQKLLVKGEPIDFEKALELLK